VYQILEMVKLLLPNRTASKSWKKRCAVYQWGQLSNRLEDLMTTSLH